MRKRKVLALLLAISLAMSGNGMTLLAAEQGTDVSTSQEGVSEGAPEGKEEEKGSSTEEDASKEEEKSEEGDKSEEGEKPEENNKSEETDPSASEKDDAGQEENGASPEDEEEIKQEEPLESENTADEAEEPEEEQQEQEAEVRMMTFTDDAGLQITFDANAAEENAEKAAVSADGVLTRVDSSVEGVVDLRDKTDITEIGANAFAGKPVTYVMLPKTVKSIGEQAFQGCATLKGVSIPSRLETIGDSAFKNCTMLTQLAIPNSVTSIGANAFSGDSRLFMVHMRSAEYSKLKEIGAEAFKGCSSLEFFCSDEAYVLPASITDIGKSAFENCKKISVVNMGKDKIASLGEGAYKGCTGLKEVTLSSSLTSIPYEAFANCTRLERIVFGNNNASYTTIKGGAFADCTGLGNILLPEQVNLIETGAFEGCEALRRVEVDSKRTEFQPNALPDENASDGMCMVGRKGSKAEEYAKKATITFVAIDDQGEKYYTYTALLSGDGLNTTTGLTINVTTSKTGGTDINKIENGPNKEKGVKAGTLCYIFGVNMQTANVSIVKGSIKCNGTVVEYKDGSYCFEMPVGGATITAEFESNAKVVAVDGDESTIEGRLSSEANYDAKNNIGHLKVGQEAKFYLTNSKDGVESRIAVSKVTYSITPSSDKGVVSVDKNGTVKALKKGEAVVMASVTTTKKESGNNKVVSKYMTIVVEEAGIDHISMVVSETGLDRNFELDKDNGRISIDTETLSRDYTFDLKAMAFSSEDDDEEMAVTFTWTTSDRNVAKLAKTSTAAGASTNKITVPKNADGEAAITVTATGADKKKVSQKFVVSARNYTPRLTASKITVNPNQVDGATELGIISAYGKAADREKVSILDAKDKKDYGDFQLKLDEEKSTDIVAVYKVMVRTGVKETTHSVLVQTQIGNRKYQVPLSITVKKSLPNPTVSLNQKAKINLFYARDGVEIETVIGRLGNDEVERYTLEPLTEAGHANYADDVKFTENFEVVTNDDGKVVIRQKVPNLLCNKSKKPVLTGYLVLKFKDYKDTATKKYKITIPTQTVAPAYVLDRTSDIFGTLFREEKIVNIQLLDKKTKKPIAWEDTYSLGIGLNTTCEGVTPELEKVVKEVDGKEIETVNIKVRVSPNLYQGRLCMILTNSKWAEGKSFTYTYTIKTDNNAPKLKLQKAAVTLNVNYPEMSEALELVSNQYDTEITGKQEFDAQSNVKTAPAFEKLSVVCENGKGTVSFREGITPEEIRAIPAGSYKYVYTYVDWNAKSTKIALTVKVVNTAPTVTLKGTNTFNLQAWSKEDGYIETSEMAVTVKNLPDVPKDLGNTQYYTFDEEAAFGGLQFATRGCESWNVQEYFDFAWVDGEKATEGKIQISLKKNMPIKTYSLKMTPAFRNGANVVRTAKPISFNIKIYNGKISVRLQARGRINLLDRWMEKESGLGEAEIKGEFPEGISEKNAIRYTPVFTNLKDTVEEVRLLDVSDGIQATYDQEARISKQFTAVIASDGKSFVITPIKGVELENRKNYSLRIWIKTRGYNFPANGGGIYVPSTVKVSTAEILPKVKTDKTSVDLYLSNKGYEATFLVQKADENAVGAIKGIAFAENDEKALTSFANTGGIVKSEMQRDGSLKVTMKLNNGVVYGCNSTNKIKMYIQFEGQGTNTAGTPITMSVKINK